MIKIKLEIENNENKSHCSECGGECCKSIPGDYHPDQLYAPEHTANFTAFLNRTIELMKTKQYRIREREDSYGRFLSVQPKVRIRNLDTMKFEDVEQYVQRGFMGLAGHCIHFSEESGCQKSFDDRPIECQKLKPIKNKHGVFMCKTPNEDESFSEHKRSWKKINRYLKIIDDMYRENKQLFS